MRTGVVVSDNASAPLRRCQFKRIRWRGGSSNGYAETKKKSATYQAVGQSGYLSEH
jgi:hypothetical protein